MERPFVAVELRGVELTMLVVDVAGVSRLIEGLAQARDELAAMLAGQNRVASQEQCVSVSVGGF